MVDGLGFESWKISAFNLFLPTDTAHFSTFNLKPFPANWYCQLPTFLTLNLQPW